MEEIGFLLIFQKNGTPTLSESMATCCDCVCVCVCAMIAVSVPALPVLGKFCFRSVFSKENRLCDHRAQSSIGGERRPMIHVLLVGSGKNDFLSV